jgi:hypothetical protein
LHILFERLQERDSGTSRLKRHVIIWSALHGLSKRKTVSTPESKRGQAVTAFVQLGDTARPILPQVRALAATDPDPGVRASALLVLRHLSPSDFALVMAQTNAVSGAAQ